MKNLHGIPLIQGVLDFLQIPYTLPLDITTSRVKLSSDTIPLSYKQFINQDLFKKHGYRDELWREIPLQKDFHKHENFSNRQ